MNLLEVPIRANGQGIPLEGSYQAGTRLRGVRCDSGHRLLRQ